jgi:cell division protein ZapA
VADVDLHIGGHVYTLSCAEGEEADLMRLAAMVDAEVSRARALAGGMTETRQLLFAAIFLAERVSETGGAESAVPIARLTGLAERIEHVGARLAHLVDDGA